MFVAMGVGIAVVWPMVRLSQVVPYEGATRWGLRDLVVVMIPVQAVVLPQMFPVLAGWSLTVVLAVDAFLCVWALVMTGLVAMAQRSIGADARSGLGGGWGNGLWMVLILVVVLAAPGFGLLTMAGTNAGIQVPRVGWLLSPVTGVLELTRDRSVLGVGASIHGAHWRMILAIGCVGLALILFGHALEVARRQGRG